MFSEERREKVDLVYYHSASMHPAHKLEQSCTQTYNDAIQIARRIAKESIQQTRGILHD
jgi:hypothetical protein